MGARALKKSPSLETKILATEKEKPQEVCLGFVLLDGNRNNKRKKIWGWSNNY